MFHHPICHSIQGHADEAFAEGPTLLIVVRSPTLVINVVTWLQMKPYASGPTGAKNVHVSIDKTFTRYLVYVFV